MSEIAPAIRQLDEALTRLEGALDSLLARTGNPDVVEAELKALMQDRVGLAEAQELGEERQRAGVRMGLRGHEFGTS